MQLILVLISEAYQTLVYQLSGVKLMINGCIPVLVTPFKANKEIDYEGLNNLVAYFIDQQVEALWVLGTVRFAPLRFLAINSL